MSARKIIIRLLTIGDSNVGKSSLLARYTDNTFYPEFVTTIGIDFKCKTVELDGKQVLIQLWDTAGQERFHSITRNYYKGAEGILLVYDVTAKSSFDNVVKWISDINTYSDGTIIKILIGNKIDLENQRVISTQMGEALAKEHNILFFETSNKNNVNVTESIDGLAKQILVTKQIPNVNTPLLGGPVDRKIKKCC
jgi:small GTP-binding protein